MSKWLTRERVIPALFLLAYALDYLHPVTRPGTVAGAWLVPALMGLGALASAVRKKREGKNANAAETYKAQRQNAIDQAEYDLAQAKRGERVRYANAIAKARGFVVPEFDTAASSGVKLNLPAVPKLKDGSWLDVVGDTLGGVGEGIMSEARLNAARDSYPSDGGAAAAAASGPGYTPFDPGFSIDPSASGASSADPYAALLGRTNYFSNLAPRGR